MHTTALRSHEFELAINGEPATIETLFDGFDERDRLGIVLAADHAAIGAATLILAAVTGFYDRLRVSDPGFFAYADYFAFHVERRRGSLRKLDVFPEHKEIVVPLETEPLLEAINDRAITRLLVPERAPVPPQLQRETRSAALRRIRSALVYSPSGRVDRGDVEVTGPDRAEAFVSAMLETTGAEPELAVRREALRVNGGQPRERLQRVSPAQALAILGGLGSSVGSAGNPPADAG